MKKMIIVLTGLSGSGKTTLSKEICKHLNFNRSVLFTTRPIRPGEIDGEDYVFLNDKEYNKLLKSGKITCHEEFIVASGDTWKYGISKEDLNDNVIIAGTPKIVKQLKNEYDNVADIMICMSNDDERLKRIYNRKDNQSKAEILRRDKDDKETYLKYIPEAVVFNDNKIIDSICEITRIITSLQLKQLMI